MCKQFQFVVNFSSSQAGTEIDCSKMASHSWSTSEILARFEKMQKLLIFANFIITELIVRYYVKILFKSKIK